MPNIATQWWLNVHYWQWKASWQSTCRCIWGGPNWILGDQLSGIQAVICTCDGANGDLGVQLSEICNICNGIFIWRGPNGALGRSSKRAGGAAGEAAEEAARRGRRRRGRRRKSNNTNLRSGKRQCCSLDVLVLLIFTVLGSIGTAKKLNKSTGSTRFSNIRNNKVSLFGTFPICNRIKGIQELSDVSWTLTQSILLGHCYAQPDR